MKNDLPIVLLYCKDPVKVAFFEKTLKGSFSLIHVEELNEGLEWLKASPIEVFILDRQDSDESLENICLSAQKAVKGKYLPILLISKSIKKSTVLEALNAGITDFIHEPLDSLEIHERITVYLYFRFVSKKMKLIRNQIKTTPLTPNNPKTLSSKTFIRDKTLKTISSSKKGAVPLSVLMIHLDSSSQLGKHSPEEVFYFLETLLKERLRKFDTFTTEGPGQYMILLPKTSPRAALAIAQDIQKEISSREINTSIKDVLITVSIGIISFEKELSKSAKDFEKFDSSLEKVKKALIRSQEKGNTIISKI